MTDTSIPLRRTDTLKDSEFSEFIVYKRKLDDHLTEFEEYKKEQLEWRISCKLAHQTTLESIEALIEANEATVKATAGVVDAWTTVNNFQRFVKWLSSFAILGGALAWLFTKLVEANIYTH